MIVVECIGKNRDKNGVIKEYILRDAKGAIKVISAPDLKMYIKEKGINVINLTLTSDNRLVSSKNKEDMTKLKTAKVEQNEQNKQETKQKGIIQKAKVLGLEVYRSTYEEYPCYLIKQNEGNYILYFPNSKEPIDTEIAEDYYEDLMYDIDGKLSVIGGENLTNITELFEVIEVDELDLCRFKPKDTILVEYKFENYIPDIYIDKSCYVETVKKLINNIETISKGRMKIAVKKTDDEHTQLTIASRNKKVRFNKTLNDSKVIGALVHLVKRSNDINDIVEDLNNRVNINLREYNYYNNHDGWAVDLTYIEEEDEVMIDLDINIKDINYDEISFRLYNGDKVVEVVDFNNFSLYDVLEVIDDLKHEAKKDLESTYYAIDEVSEKLQKVVDKFNEIKQRYKYDGITIDIEAEVSINGDINDIEKYGYQNADNFMGLNIEFYSLPYKSGILYGNDILIWDDSSELEKHPEEYTGACKFIHALIGIADNCEEGSIIKLMVDSEKCEQSPKKLKFDVNGVIKEVEVKSRN